MPKIKTSIFKTFQNFKQMTPVLIGVVMIVAFLTVVIPESFYAVIFTGNKFFDPVIGGILGSLAAGNPIISYIIGGELLENGVSLVAVAAFIITWVTVGIAHLPAESLFLGKKFAAVRNGVSYGAAILIAILLVLSMNLI